MSKIKGIRRRWMVNSISAVFFIILLAVSAFSVAMAGYYYDNMLVGLETRFEVKNRAYFDAVLYGGRLEEIRAAKQELCTVLYTELAHMMEVQLIVTVAAVTFVGNFLRAFV